MRRTPPRSPPSVADGYHATVTWREDRLLDWLSRRARPAALVGSFAHDSAVLVAQRGRRVACVDQTIEGVHFEPGSSGRRVGRKAVGRAVSDLAASAARPTEVLLALAAQRTKSERWMRAVIAGCAERARELGAELVGGDLARTDGSAYVAVTALGELDGDGLPPGRDCARPGQVLLLTGPVGGSRLGRHLAIEPRIAEGRWLWERGATVLMDVSDGLAIDAARIASASRAALAIDVVPVHRDARRAARASGRSARLHALEDGEDHELLACIDRARWEAIRRAARRRFPALVEIGRVQAGRGLRVAGEDGMLVPYRSRGGWLHV